MVESIHEAKASITPRAKEGLKKIASVTGNDPIIDAFLSGIIGGPLMGKKPVSLASVVAKVRDNIASEYLFKLIEGGVSKVVMKSFEGLIGRQNDFCNSLIGKKSESGFTPNARHNLSRLLMGIDPQYISNPALKTLLKKENKKKLIENTKSVTGLLRPFILAVIESFNTRASYYEISTENRKHGHSIYIKRIVESSFVVNYMLKSPGNLYDSDNLPNVLNNKGPRTTVLNGIEAVMNMSYTLDHEFNNIMLAIVDHPIFETIMKGKSLDESSTKAKIAQSRHYIKEGVQFWEEIGRGKFYSNYVVDFRGRITQLGGISSVASKPCKAMLRSGIAAPLGEHGYKHLLIGIAGAMGKDKDTFRVRERYVRDNLLDFYEIGEHIISNPVGVFTRLVELGADDPFQAAALCLELYRCHEDKEYKPNVFVGYDATSSAVQLVGLLMGNRTLTEASNIRVGEDTEDKIHDSYMLLANIMDTAAPKFRNEENKDIVDMWIGFDQKTKRAFAKPLLMTRLYGSKFQTWRDRSRETAIEKGIIDPKDKDLVKRFGVVMAQLFQVAFDNEEGFNCLRSYEDFAKSIAKAYASKGLPTIWTMQDGTQFKGQEIVSKYTKFEGERYSAYVNGKKMHMRSYGLDLISDIQEELNLKESRELNKSKLSSAISPNYIHSHDALLLYSAVLKMNTTMRLTHDCFGAVPGRAEEMLKALNNSCVELFGDNNLKQLEAWRDECYVRTGIEVEMPSNYREEGIPSSEINKATYKFS